MILLFRLYLYRVTKRRSVTQKSSKRGLAFAAGFGQELLRRFCRSGYRGIGKPHLRLRQRENTVRAGAGRGRDRGGSSCYRWSLLPGNLCLSCLIEQGSEAGELGYRADTREPQRSAPDLEADLSEYSAVMRNRRSVAGNRNLRRKIFDIRRSTCFSLKVWLYRAALGIPSPAGLIFGRKSKYPSIQLICELRNKCGSRVRNSLARSRLYLPGAEKNRWTCRTSTGFSLLPAAGQTLC